MKKVVAALDDSLAARPVTAAARALGRVLGAAVDPVHVDVGGGDVARAAADAEGLELRVVTGAIGERMLTETRADDVVGVVIGARGTPARRRPLGSTALELASALPKPVLVVPPDAPVAVELRRVLVPVDSASPTLAPLDVFALAPESEIEVVVLHLRDAESLPLFTDQPQHEHETWAREFLRRYCPEGIGATRLETRVGRLEEVVPAVAEESHVDLVALAWARELAPERAPVVGAALLRSSLPVMLVPVRVLRTARVVEPAAV